MNLDNERKYLQTIAAKGGGSAAWANQQAKKYGISLNTPTPKPAPVSPPRSSSEPNQFQMNQMRDMVQNQGQISDFYKNKFGSDFNPVQHEKVSTPPTYTYHTPSSDSKGAIDYVTSGKMARDTGKTNFNAYNTLGGQILDTTHLTPQQTNAAMLFDEVNAGRRKESDALAILAGMGLDRYGNPTGVWKNHTPTYGGSQGVPVGALPNTSFTIDPHIARAAAMNARILAQKEAIANQQIAGITDAFNRSNAILKDNRLLEDDRLSRTLNPFSGRTSYDKALVGRERTLADEAAQGQYNSAIQGVQAGLAADKNAAAQEIMEKAYQMEQDAKKRDLEYARVFGSLPDGSQPTLVAQELSRNIAKDQRDFDYKVGRDKIFDQRYDDNFAYKIARDAIDDERYKAEFDRDAKQFGLRQALEKARLNNKISSDAADRALRERELLIRENKATAESMVNMDEEKRGLVDALRGGKITPEGALKQIEEDVRLGFYTQSEAKELNNVIQTLTINQPVIAPTLTEEQSKSMPPDERLNKIYESEGKGYPIIDWKQWYTDPRGRLAGVPYERWHLLYGPRLKAR